MSFASLGVALAIGVFGNWGMLLVFIPILIAFFIGLDHFSKLEKKEGFYPGFEKTASPDEKSDQAYDPFLHARLPSKL